MKDKAIILTNGLLATFHAKTAHGLIRGTERYEIVGVVDPPTAGRDAGEVLDGKRRDISVYASVEQAIEHNKDTKFAIVGVATPGGVLPPEILAVIKMAIRNGLSIVNGLHEFLHDMPDVVRLSKKHRVTLTDVRKPKSRKDLHFWSGDIFDVTAPIIAVMGMDCTMGKRTTCRMIRQACERQGVNAQMIHTGQTGWLQGGQYGFVLDSTLNDFVSGELEHAIVSCWKETAAQVLLIEGQSALRNPSGPCGLEFLISGNAKRVVLIHSPKRKYFDYEPRLGPLPSVESEIALIRSVGSEVIALALHTEDCTTDEAFEFQKMYQISLGIPVLLPLQEGVDKLVGVIKELIVGK